MQFTQLGFGDDGTWPAPDGHPNDPRTEDAVSLDEMTVTELIDLAEDMSRQRDELLAALKTMTQTFIDGTHYRTVNPYLRPEVKAALIAIGKAEGKSVFGFDWQDALKGYANAPV